MIDAYVGLGANVGDRMGNLRAALGRLHREPGFRVAGVSRVWDTAPVGPPPKIAGAKEITVAGRRVSFHNRTKRTLYVAKWKTAKAQYTSIADGATQDSAGP